MYSVIAIVWFIYIIFNTGWQGERLHKTAEPIPRTGRPSRSGRDGPSRGGEESLVDNQRARPVRSEEQAVRDLRRRPVQSHRRQTFPHVRHDEIPETPFRQLSARTTTSFLFYDMFRFFFLPSPNPLRGAPCPPVSASCSVSSRRFFSLLLFVFFF